jgi:hypothetical protein
MTQERRSQGGVEEEVEVLEERRWSADAMVEEEEAERRRSASRAVVQQSGDAVRAVRRFDRVVTRCSEATM